MRAPGSRAALASAFRLSSASGACSTTTSICARRPGQGSRFSVEVPLSTAEPSIQTPREFAVVDRGRLLGTSVVCIDNEPKVLDGMETLLGGWGCQVLKAPDLATAIAAIEQVGPDPQRPPGRLPSRQQQWRRGHRRIAPPLRRRVARDPDHRGPVAAGARRGALAQRPGAEQTAEARGAPRPDGAMARAAGGGGVAAVVCIGISSPRHCRA